MPAMKWIVLVVGGLSGVNGIMCPALAAGVGGDVQARARVAFGCSQRPGDYESRRGRCDGAICTGGKRGRDTGDEMDRRRGGRAGDCERNDVLALAALASADSQACSGVAGTRLEGFRDPHSRHWCCDGAVRTGGEMVGRIGERLGNEAGEKSGERAQRNVGPHIPVAFSVR